MLEIENRLGTISEMYMHESPLMDHFVCNSKYNHHLLCVSHTERDGKRQCDSSRESKPLTHTPLIENDDYEYVGARVTRAEFSKACNEDIILRHDLITFSGFISYKSPHFVAQNLTNANVFV